MQVVILCGGQGTRAYPYTQSIPKALMEIGGVPIVEHVMRIYAAQGFKDFILSCGYLKQHIFDYFDHHPGDWNVRCVDTGDDADTAERISRLRDLLEPVFHATYCDGLADIDLNAVVRYHESHSGIATLTTAQFRSQYGLIGIEADGRVSGFEEKPILPNLWINGGFFVFDRRALEYWRGRNLERDVLPALANAGQLRAYRHRGFWRSMDTYKDQQELNRAWSTYADRYASDIVRLGSPASVA
jgi:glucose-1-phosphate cytidylyltransferase